jgi:hypothetical protein
VAANEACLPVLLETLMFLLDLQMITKEDKAFPTPEIARPRIPHDILFAIGGCTGEEHTDYIETYDIRADRCIEVSCTQIYLYCALLNNACKKNPFLFVYFYHLIGFLYTFI